MMVLVAQSVHGRWIVMVVPFLLYLSSLSSVIIFHHWSRSNGHPAPGLTVIGKNGLEADAAEERPVATEPVAEAVEAAQRLRN